MFLLILHDNNDRFSATSFSKKKFCNKKLIFDESLSDLPFIFPYIRVTVSYLMPLVLDCWNITNQWRMVYCTELASPVLLRYLYGLGFNIVQGLNWPLLVGTNQFHPVFVLYQHVCPNIRQCHGWVSEKGFRIFIGVWVLEKGSQIYINMRGTVLYWPYHTISVRY